ncbi:hypothetical protein [Haliscomenobacter sp.]|uniref:hypothetical protein n=1 Tax=Haliscomenobacter sp. TaxID=2717303 RepID=UPI0035938033
MKLLLYFFTASYFLKLFQLFIVGSIMIYIQTYIAPVNDYNFKFLFYTLLTFFSIYIALICPIWALFFNVILYMVTLKNIDAKGKIITISLLMICIEALFMGHYKLASRFPSSLLKNADTYEFNRYFLVVCLLIIDLFSGLIYGLICHKIYNKIYGGRIFLEEK